jgi:hypothetical protein
MKYATPAIAALLLTASPIAFAQQPGAVVPGVPGATVVSPSSAPATTTDRGMTVRQTLVANLTKAGFTDVKIRPEAYIVEAVNEAGQPVRMFISPDSMTVFTAVNAQGEDAMKATGHTGTEHK